MAVAQNIEFATQAEGRKVLAQRDSYVRATSPLERQAWLRSTQTVSEPDFMRHQANQVVDWPPETRQRLAPIIARLKQFAAPVRAQWPARVLLVRIDDRLGDGAAFTRGNAAFVFDKALADEGAAHYFLSHELFHILTRNNPELREKLYAAIGFRRCVRPPAIPDSVARLRITNPDAVENAHTIRVRHRGETVDALPYIRFASRGVDPKAGVIGQLEVRWIIVDRSNDDCKIRQTAGGVADAEPAAFEGLNEQVGQNTAYLLHPEEILADNFSLLFLASVTGTPPKVASPGILEQVKKILFER